MMATTRSLVVIAAAAAVAGCAPDAFRRDREFEAWLAELRQVCGETRIGLVRIESLLRSTGSREGNNFINLTSRLWAGSITEEQWTSSVTSFLRGRPTDAGVRCTLDQLPKR